MLTSAPVLHVVKGGQGDAVVFCKAFGRNTSVPMVAPVLRLEVILFG